MSTLDAVPPNWDTATGKKAATLRNLSDELGAQSRPSKKKVVMRWAYLMAAIVFEVGGTVSLKLSDGLSRRGLAVAMAILYGLSFLAFTQALRRMEVGVAYALFSALGTALMASVGILWFKEPATLMKVAALAMIVIGVLCLNLSSRVVAK